MRNSGRSTWNRNKKRWSCGRPTIKSNRSMQGWKRRYANGRLKEMDRLKSQFLAHVSHELRTPLTGIKGLTENLLDGLGGPLTTKQEHNLRRVVDNAGRLARMITHLLERSRIEAGKIDLTLREV